MKDKYIKFEDYKAELLKNPKLKKVYDDLDPKYAIISAVLDARIRRGVTQSELAKRMGTKQSAIARLESGTYNPSVDFLCKMAKALEVNLEIKFS